MAQLLQEQQGGGAGAAEQGPGVRAGLHRASGSGSSLGGGAPQFPAGVTAAIAAMQETAHSGGSNGGSNGGSGDYNRSNGFEYDGSPCRGASGEYAASAAMGQAAAAAAATAAAAAAAAAADDPGPTPAHPRAMARTAGMSASAAGVPAAAIAAAAADGAAGLAPQFAVAAAAAPPQSGLRAAAAAAAGVGVPAAALGGLEALIYHPTDSAMKPIVGNKR